MAWCVLKSWKLSMNPLDIEPRHLGCYEKDDNTLLENSRRRSITITRLFAQAEETHRRVRERIGHHNVDGRELGAIRGQRKPVRFPQRIGVLHRVIIRRLAREMKAQGTVTVLDPVN